MVILNDIREAQARLSGVAVRTELIETSLGEYAAGPDGRKLYLKPENLQPIGAFKLRGAYNKIASLSAEDRSRGVITYSSGNHGQGVAYAARALGTKAVVVMPNNTPPSNARQSRPWAPRSSWLVLAVWSAKPRRKNSPNAMATRLCPHLTTKNHRGSGHHGTGDSGRPSRG